LFATEALGRIADASVQIHGGHGVMRELWIEAGLPGRAYLPDLRGTSEVQRMVIAQGLLADT